MKNVCAALCAAFLLTAAAACTKVTIHEDNEAVATAPSAVVVPNPNPTAPVAQPACLTFKIDVVDTTHVEWGKQVTLSWTSNTATQHVEGFGDWTRDSLPPNGSETIIPTKVGKNTYNIRCVGGPGTTPSAPLSVTVDTFQSTTVCPAVADYTSPGNNFAIAVGQSKTLTSNVSESAPCDPFWGVDRPDLGSLIGSDRVEVIDGKQYPVGKHAVVKRIAPGDFRGFIQPSIVNTAKTFHTWTTALTTASLLAPAAAPTGPMIMFDVHDDGTVWYHGRPVEQGGPPQR